MKNLLMLLPLFFVLMFSCDNTTDGCETNSECGEDEVCFYASCYNKDDKVLGIKTIHLIGNPNVKLVAGEEAELRAQVVLAPTKEMSEKFKDHEEELTKILGPIKDAEVNFSIVVIGETLSTVDPSDVTDTTGMVSSVFKAGDDNAEKLINIDVKSEDCVKKRFNIVVSKRAKRLLLKTDTEMSVYINSKRTIIAQVLTNDDLPYADQEVNFKLEGNTSGSDASINLTTVITNFAGIAKIELNAGDQVANYNIKVSSLGVNDQVVAVEVKERDGGCEVPEDCSHLGPLYECSEDKVCVFVPKPCVDENDCPENHICNEDKECEVKPFICDEDELDTCRCVKSSNCPNGLSCVRHRCVEENVACTTHLDCPNGLLCLDNVCSQRGRECKIDSNCNSREETRERCPNEDSCVCEDGYCINPCPDTNYIELSGGSGENCTTNADCLDESGDDIGEVCFTAHNVNKCITRWDANYDFHLIEALPPTLQSILSGVGALLGPMADIINGDDIDWGLPGWLSWVEEALVALARPYIDQYVPSWVQDLIVGLDDSINILKEMRVKADMAFVHDEEIHSDIKGFEFWDTFYVEWKGTWTEVKPNSDEDGDDFQINSAPFTGSISCQLENNEPKYVLYIDRHAAEFYFGRFVKAFIDNLLIPSVTNDQAHNIGEVLDLYIDCESIGDQILEAARNYLGDWAEYLPAQLFTAACELAKDKVEDKIYDKLSELKFGNTENESDTFTFGGSATIQTRNIEGRKLIDGKYTGTLDVGGARNFTADWEAQKAR